MLKFLLTLTGFLISVSPASATDACSQLSVFTCEPGTYADGTGSTTLPLEAANKNLRANYDKALMPVFERALNDATKSAFRNEVVQALGSDLATCTANNATQTRACNQTLAKRLSDFLSLETLVGDYVDRVDYMKMYDLTASPEFRELTTEGMMEVEKTYSVPQKADKIKKVILPNVKKNYEQKISQMSIDPAVKRQLIRKIQSVEFAGTDCGELNDNPYDPSTFIDELYYSLGFYSNWDNTLKICKGLLTEGYSEFAVTQIVARELARSIDLCSFAQENSSNNFETLSNTYPFKDLMSCLRSAPSRIIATPPDLTPVERACEQDQATLAFADWFATDATVETISASHPGLSSQQWQKGMANISRANCESSAEDNGSLENGLADLNSGIDKIIAANPAARTRMGCARTVPSCNLAGMNESSSVRPRAKPARAQEGTR